MDAINNCDQNEVPEGNPGRDDDPFPHRKEARRMVVRNLRDSKRAAAVWIIMLGFYIAVQAELLENPFPPDWGHYNLSSPEQGRIFVGIIVAIYGSWFAAGVAAEVKLFQATTSDDKVDSRVVVDRKLEQAGFWKGHWLLGTWINALLTLVFFAVVVPCCFVKTLIEGILSVCIGLGLSVWVVVSRRRSRTNARSSYMIVDRFMNELLEVEGEGICQKYHLEGDTHEV